MGRFSVLVGLVLFSTNIFASDLSTTFPFVFKNGQRLEHAVVIATVKPAEEIVNIQIFDDVCGSLKSPGGAEVVRCMAEPGLIESLDLAITGHDSDCGSDIYYAVLDGTAAEQAKIDFKFQDHSHRVCKDLKPKAEAELNIFNTFTGHLKTYRMVTDLYQM